MPCKRQINDLILLYWGGDFYTHLVGMETEISNYIGYLRFHLFTREYYSYSERYNTRTTGTIQLTIQLSVLIPLGYNFELDQGGQSNCVCR